VDSALTSYIRVRMAAGYQGISFSGNNDAGDSGSASGWYANASLIHKISPVAMQTLVIGHETELGTYSNYSTINFAQHTVTWNIVYKLTLQTDLRFEDSKESGRADAEHYQRYGASIAASYPITEKLNAALRYQWLRKNSNISDRKYTQNQILLDLNYSF
jgi:hypothetical protein